MGGGDQNLYRSSDARSSVGRGVLRTLGFLVGVGAGFAGIGLFVLRCFGTCPADAVVDAIWQLLSGALVLTGLAIVIEAISFRTTWAAAAAGVVIVLGALIALTGIVSLALLPSVEGSGGSWRTAGSALLAVVVGASLAVNSVRERQSRRTQAQVDGD